MEQYTDKIINYLCANQNRNHIELCKIKLGIEIMLHNFVMVFTILVFSYVLDFFKDAAILLSAYGLLKISAGGIHLKKSSSCLFFTFIFIAAGSKISHIMNLSLLKVIILYLICTLTLYIIGPQGTDNNPFSNENFNRMRTQSIIITFIYAIITLIMYATLHKIPFLFLIATVFETLSLIPYYIKKKQLK